MFSSQSVASRRDISSNDTVNTRQGEALNDFPVNSEKPENRLARLLPAAEPIPERAPPNGMPPNERRCTGIAKGGGRCSAWALTGEPLCAGHAGISLEAARSARSIQAEARRSARLSIRERAAQSLDDDWPDVLKALQIGLKEGKPSERSRVAVSYVQLVYGRQLQQRDDEQPDQSDDLASLTREERDKLKRELLAEHPDLAARLRLAG